jgi:deoxyhypusine monooxygenase
VLQQKKTCDMSFKPPLPLLRECLLDLSQPIAKRTQAAFYLRTDGSEDAMRIVCEALLQRADSSLMRHELAYILGQIQNPKACETLSQILDDETDDVLVRHESAEALGAINQESSLPILTKYSTHASPEIAETCQIAIDLINWNHSAERETDLNKSLYLSHDPAPPLAKNQKLSLSQLEAILLDPSVSLFQRYRAMFSLRDLNNDAAALALVKGFADQSALFRHEIAFVLGQMQRKAYAPGEKWTLQYIHFRVVLTIIDDI